MPPSRRSGCSPGGRHRSGAPPELSNSCSLTTFQSRGSAGGAVYDALVGATAAAAGVRLTTRDRRALDTYRALDLDFEILD